jgi:8-oxo-dGTP diphosphatase
MIRFVLLGLVEDSLKVLLTRSGGPPGKWKFPGGSIERGMDLETGVQRLFSRLVGVETVFLEQLPAFVQTGNRDADALTIPYWGMLNRAKYKNSIRHADVEWVGSPGAQHLAEGDCRLYHVALGLLRERIRREPIGFYQLPREFRMQQLRRVYELILGKSIPDADFRERIWKLDLVVPLPEPRKYRFNEKKYRELKRKGYYFHF